MRLTQIPWLTAMWLLTTTGVSAQADLRQSFFATQPALPNSKMERLFEQTSAISQKSPLLAIAYSLILPGLGDIYAQNTATGTYFIGADVTLWLAYAGVRSYGHWMKDDARGYAVYRAGANFSGKSDQFEVDLGNFNTVQEYNEAKLRNRQYDLIYDQGSSYAWQWASEGERLRFKDMRIKGDEILRNSQFVIGALVINRVIAAISAARSATGYNKAQQTLSGWRLQASPVTQNGANPGIGLVLTKEF